MTTCVITLWNVSETSLTTFMSAMHFLIEIFEILKAIKGHMINRILHAWSFQKKIMKLAKGSFHKFHMKMTTHLRFSINVMTLSIGHSNTHTSIFCSNCYLQNKCQTK